MRLCLILVFSAYYKLGIVLFDFQDNFRFTTCTIHKSTNNLMSHYGLKTELYFVLIDINL